MSPEPPSNGEQAMTKKRIKSRSEIISNRVDLDTKPMFKNALDEEDFIYKSSDKKIDNKMKKGNRRKKTLSNIDEESNPSFASNLSPNKDADEFNELSENLDLSDKEAKFELQKFSSEAYKDMDFNLDQPQENRRTEMKKSNSFFERRSQPHVQANMTQVEPKRERRERKVNTPKLLVLASMHPIYYQMQNFLMQIKGIMEIEDKVPFERMMINLLYEFPHPGENTQIISRFWKQIDLYAASKLNQQVDQQAYIQEKLKQKNFPYEYELRETQNYCDIRHYQNKEILDILSYYLKAKTENGNIDLIWNIIEHMLLDLSVVLVCKDSKVLAGFIEIKRIHEVERMILVNYRYK